ncbi:MAG TPA: TIGR03364 family FAD-dependent oxidoreductase [Chitinophagaceae bacterium]|nr:TIGR03364 family FAD-dependent oxidoreductase [Chitinophagaceae bacterium]
MQSPHYDLIVIGAGALGSFHAYHAASRKLKVLLLEKDYQPQEATVRNFGQVVPSGKSRGRWQHYGIRSQEIYTSLQARFDISVRQQGSVYIASDETELILLNELRDINRKEGYHSMLLRQADCLERYPGLKADYCKGALLFPEEITVEPAVMIHRLIAYMREQLNVTYQPHTLVTFCDYVNGKCIAEDSLGRAYTSNKIIICNGRDFRQLFPEVFYASDIEVSKLQMMRTVPQPGYTLKGSILTGLSIRRYESFRECPSYDALKASEIPASFREWGIHILFKQAIDGSIIIGDSHEYADARDQDRLGFETNQAINDIIIEEAKRIFDLPSWQIAACWNGYYSQSKSHDVFRKEVADNIHVVTAIGGKGMTGSAGLAEESIAGMFS